MVTAVMFFSTQIVNLRAAGHFGDPVILAAVGLGNMSINLFCLALVESMDSTLETLVPQAFGANNLTLCGVYLNGGRFLLLIINIPIFIFFQYLDSIYIALGQEEDISHIMKDYINYCLLACLLYGFCDLQKRFLNSLGRNFMVMNCFTFGILLHVFWVWLFTS